ncbi:peptidoglycan-binding domain-containing protein [Rhodovulum marinum]|uniref:Putative peptidoglycan binding protein n=1 Tax=Rhodovulum marinum TaxID=320662 RepID=A0A4R2Q0A2_9RHOB|nr:peptidoglycan-binding protein [Rhodovulum marinum]TCP41877.1 putative peptidoglycan binding protein [Rhodovulum marinum]
MLFRSVIAAGALAATVCVSPATAEQAQRPVRAEADAVFSLRNVESIAFDEAHDGLFAIADGRLMHWSLFPLELKASLALDTLASDLAISPAGNLFVAGQRWNQQSLLLLGGSILAFPVDPETGIEDWFRLYQVADNATGYSQFSSVAFDGAGHAYFGSPVAFSILVVPDDLTSAAPGTRRGTVDLRCGASAQLSVLEAGGQVFYFSSTIEGAALEFGVLDGSDARKGGAECFRVANIYAQNAAPATFYSIRHAVITRPAPEEGGEPWQAVLALDPNNGRLYLFEIEIVDGQILISRKRSAEIDLAALEPAARAAGTGTYGLIAASGDGSEIYVSGSSMRRVLRFSVTEAEGLVSRGAFELEAPVQGMEIGAEGRYAAVVTGENRFGADRVLTILRDPGAVPVGAPLPASFESIRLIQDLLNASGFNAGRVDGIYGPRTIEAVKAYLDSRKAAPDLGEARGGIGAGSGEDILRAVIEGVFPRKAAD